MKKFSVVFLLVAILCSVLCGCKSKEARNVDKLIKQIGDVTLDSGSIISEVEKAVDELTEEQLAELDGIEYLKEARNTYEILVLQDKAAKVDEVIENIGTITKDSGDDINKAKTLVSELPSDALKYLKNKSILVDAEFELKAVLVDEKIYGIGDVTLSSKNLIVSARNRYNELNEKEKSFSKALSVLEEAEKQYNVLSSNDVVVLIEQIGEVKLDSETEIKEARIKYDDLLDEGKRLVTNYDVLTKAENQFEILKKEDKEKRLNTALSRVKTNTDRVNGVTWYHPKQTPNYANIRSYILPYIGKFDSGLNVLHMVYHYTGDNWVFYDEIIFLIDGDRRTKTFSYGDVDRDNGYGDVWERADTRPTKSEIEMLKKIAESKETIVRFQGDSKQYDFTVSAADKQAINDVLTIYEIWEE